MTAPSIVGHATGVNGGGSTVSLANPAAAAAGDQMLAWLSADGSNTSISDPAGWTVLLDATFNTRRAYLLVRPYAASYSPLTLSGTRGIAWTVLAIRDTPDAPTLGTPWKRVDNGGAITTTQCPSIATQPADTLAIALVTETSTGAETEGQISHTGTGWTKYLYWDSNTSDDVAPNHWLGQRTLDSAGATGLITTTWPNASNNSLGVQVAYPPTAEHKTAAAAIALDLDTTGHSTKAARSGAALALDLDTSSDPAKTGLAATLLEAALTLQATGAKHARAATSLAALLGLDTATTKRAAAATGIDLALTLAATTDLAPEHKTAAATLGLTLALDALAGKTAATGTTVTLALDTTGDATKTGAAVVGLHLVLDAIATAAKTGSTEAALSLALAIAAAIVTDTTTPECRTLHIAADDRVITITADDRTLTIDRQDRTITIGAA